MLRLLFCFYKFWENIKICFVLESREAFSRSSMKKTQQRATRRYFQERQEEPLVSPKLTDWVSEEAIIAIYSKL